MENLIKRFWINSIVVIIGFSLISCDNNNEEETVNPGFFTLTGIPGEYFNIINTMTRAYLEGPEGTIVGCLYNEELKLIQGMYYDSDTVKLPLWNTTGTPGNYTITDRYVGNDTYNLTITLTKRFITDAGETTIATRKFNNVTFSKGNATRAWNQGTE